MNDIYDYSSWCNTKDRFHFATTVVNQPVNSINALCGLFHEFFPNGLVEHEFTIEENNGDKKKVRALAEKPAGGQVNEGVMYAFTIRKERQRFERRPSRDDKVTKEITKNDTRTKWWTSRWVITLYSFETEYVTRFNQTPRGFDLATISKFARQYVKERQQGFPDVHPTTGEISTTGSSSMGILTSLLNLASYRNRRADENAWAKEFSLSMNLQTGSLRILDANGKPVTDGPTLKRLFTE